MAGFSTREGDNDASRSFADIGTRAAMIEDLRDILGEPTFGEPDGNSIVCLGLLVFDNGDIVALCTLTPWSIDVLLLNANGDFVSFKFI